MAENQARRWIDDPAIIHTDPVTTPPRFDPGLETLRLKGDELAAKITERRAAQAAELAQPLPRGPRPFHWLRWIALPARTRQIERVLHLQGEPFVPRWILAVSMAWSVTRDE